MIPNEAARAPTKAATVPPAGFGVAAATASKKSASDCACRSTGSCSRRRGLSCRLT